MSNAQTRARTGAGVKFYISDAAVTDADLDLQDFESGSITWVRINGVTEVGEGGVTTNSATQSFLGEDVDDVSKVTDTPNTVPVTISKRFGDAGQAKLAEAAGTRQIWLFKLDRDDSPDGIIPSSGEYMRGQVGGPSKPRGDASAYQLEVYQIMQKQRPVEFDTSVSSA